MSTVKFLEASAVTYSKIVHKDRAVRVVAGGAKQKSEDTAKSEVYDYELHGG